MKTFDFLKLLSAALLLGVMPFLAQAQGAKSPLMHTARTTIVEGLADLSGAVPDTTLCTSGRPKMGSKGGIEKKIFMLYNVGTGQFFSQGGTYGTHATLSKVPYLLWLECDSTDKADIKYYIATNAESTSSKYYLGTSGDPHSKYADVFLVNDRTNIYFKKVDNDEGKNIYNIQVGTNGWQHIVALPNGNTVNGEHRAYDKVGFRWLTDEDAANYPTNAQWKLISLAEYYELFDQEPASITSPVEATFKMKDHEFRLYSSETDDWQTTGDVASVIRFGDETMYRVHSSQGGSASSWTGVTDAHQRAYGRLTYAYAKGKRGYTVYQDIQVKYPGWYLLRSNGMSSQNAISGESSPLAHLFICLVENGTASTTHTSSVSLRGVSQTYADSLKTTNDGCGIGVAFDDGTWQKQTQICVEEVNGEAISEDNPATLRIGWRVDEGTTSVSDDEITAVDAFEFLYAGERRKPELILNEDETDMKYIMMATDAYTNNVLHLKRTLNPDMWNTIILPVSLNKQQVLNAFGSDVKLAKLTGINSTALIFLTAEAESDNDVMLEAFTPYIIKPSNTNMESEAYTVDRFYTTDTQDKWLSTDYSETSSEEGRLQKTVAANHYVIPLVTIDRTELQSHLKDYNTTTGESTWELNANNAISQTGGPGTITCTGTFAKTFDATGTDGTNEIISGRDDLNGAYFMYKGKLIQVPTGNMDNGERYQYGIKGFRCWFRLSNAESSSKNAMQVVIDGIIDQTTSISETTSDGKATNHRAIDGVYNLNGQKVREGSSTDGLSKGIYIIKGEKVAVK